MKPEELEQYWFTNHLSVKDGLAYAYNLGQKDHAMFIEFECETYDRFVELYIENCPDTIKQVPELMALYSHKFAMAMVKHNDKFLKRYEKAPLKKEVEASHE